MAVVSVAQLLHCQGGVLMGVWRGIALAIFPALFAACSAAAPTPTLAPTPEPTPTLAAAPTPVAKELLINKPESFEGYTLYPWGPVYLIDHLGRTVHKWTPDPESDLAKLLDNGNLLLHGNKEIDVEGNVVWNYHHPQHHDLLKMPNGNVLILFRLTISREEAIEIGANPNAFSCSFLWGEHIVEAQPTGPADAEIVWEWSVFDHIIQDFDPEKPNYGRVEDHPELVDINYNLDTPCISDTNNEVKDVADWMHSNALDYNADLDQIMLTVRHFSEMWIIDHSTSAEESTGHAGGNSGKGGDLLYRWGNPRAYRRGNDADQRLFWPHNAHWIPDGSPGAGNVLIFNNGSERAGMERGYSSVEEIALPADGYNYRIDEGSAYGPNARVWRYAADPPESFYSRKMGSAQRLPNGNTLISDNGPSKRRIFEVTQEGEQVWEVAPLMQDDRLYRSYRYAPDHPGIQEILGFYRTIYREAVAGEPIARGEFDLHLADNELTYIKDPCDPEDATPRVFLHVEPERMDDLQEGRQRYGFNNLNFDFLERGAAFDGKCVARVPLPDYPIASIQTGQFTPDGELWRVEFGVGDEPLSLPRSAEASLEAPSRLPRPPYAGRVAAGRWLSPHPRADNSTIYSDASVHRVISDLSAFIGGWPKAPRIIAAGDLNTIYGATEESALETPIRAQTIFDRMDAIGMEFVGPRAGEGGRKADPPSVDVPPDTRNVPTYHSNRASPETARNQLDYAFVSHGFGASVSVRAMNGVDEWGPSDHCRIVIEVG